MEIIKGKRCFHKKYGLGVICDLYSDIHGREEETLCFFSPDEKLPNHDQWLLVEVEDLKEIYLPEAESAVS